MADRWYFAHDENRKGPYSGQQLKEMAAGGQILPTDTVWKEGITQGALASKVRYLFQPAAPVPAHVAESPLPVADILTAAEVHGTLLPLDTPGVAVEAEISPTETAAVALAPAEAKAPPAAQPHVRKGRAVAGRGAMIQSQDGVNVKFKKKCTVCGYEDSSWTTVPIRAGTIRSSLFCRKCRKSRDVEIHGQLS